MSAVIISSCGEALQTPAPSPGASPPSGPNLPSAEALGGFNLACTQNGQEQQQQTSQVPFQAQQACVQRSGQQAQKFQFIDSKISDFDVVLDCDNNVVVVRSKGADQERQTLPIGADGTVSGQLTFQNQVADDGKGSGQCWVQNVVTFNGKASCTEALAQLPPAPTSTPTTLASVGPTTSPTPLIQGPGLQLTAEVSFEPSSADKLAQAGIAMPGPAPTSTAAMAEMPGIAGAPSGGISTQAGAPGIALPGQSPSPRTTASPAASPLSSPSASPTALPTPTATPVKFCIVDNPCPIDGTTGLSCGQAGQSPTPSPTQTPTRSPAPSPTQSPTQSPTPGQSPTQSPTP